MQKCRRSACSVSAAALPLAQQRSAVSLLPRPPSFLPPQALNDIALEDYVAVKAKDA